MSGLWLSSLRLSHLRSHRGARLSPDPRPVAIHGPNGAGKTNLLEAVSLLSPGRGLRGVASMDLARRPDALGWKVAGTVEGGPVAHEIVTWAREGPRRVEIDGKPTPQTGLGRVTRILWLVPAMDRIWAEGAEARRRFLDRATLSFDPGHAARVLSYDKAMRDRNRLLRDGARDPHWYRALEAQMARAGADIDAARADAVARLTEAQDGQAFPAADLTLTAPEGAGWSGEDGLRDALAASRPRDMAAGRTLVGPHRSDLGAILRLKGIPARDCSTGEQKALLLSIMLANARALAMDGAAPLLLLDEVAAHLDAGRRAALYDAICGLGGQAWMTGTGPELFEELGPRAQRIEVTEADGESVVRPHD
ncbi:MAG: DNA replication/repair protein RecF [Paracoccaceae bacterium]